LIVVSAASTAVIFVLVPLLRLGDKLAGASASPADQPPRAID
jgi:hypothetical protein